MVWMVLLVRKEFRVKLGHKVLRGKPEQLVPLETMVPMVPTEQMV